MNEDVMYYRLTQTDYDGESFTFPEISVNCSSASKVFVCPNPVNDILNIITETEVEYQLYDLEGQKVLSGKEKTINMANLASGMYFLKIYDDTGIIYSGKVIKK